MKPTDVINFPNPYARGRLIESIDVVVSWGFCHHLACVVKYLARIGHKKAILEDLKRAEWYLERAISIDHAELDIGCNYMLKRPSTLIPQLICDDWQLSDRLSNVLHNLLMFHECTSLEYRKKALESALIYLKEEISIYAHNSTNPKITSDGRKPIAFNFYKEIERQLEEHIKELATRILKAPNKGNEHKPFWRYGQKGGIAIGIKGKYLGVYTNFEKDIKGGPLKLIEAQLKFSLFKEILKWASQWLGTRGVSIRSESKNLSNWVPIVPEPADVEEPDIVNNPYLNKILSGGFEETSGHAYRDEQSNLKGDVFRFEKPDPNDPNQKIQITPPLAYCKNEHGHQFWRWKAFESHSRSLYGLEKLACDPQKPILVVEGEKTADAVQNILPEYHMISWCGGVHAPRKSNWLPLVGRTVVIWPDNDEPGHHAAQAIRNILTALNCQDEREGTVSIVSLPPMPLGWDLANSLPNGWTLQTIQEILTKAHAVTLSVPMRDSKSTQQVTSDLQVSNRGGVL